MLNGGPREESLQRSRDWFKNETCKTDVFEKQQEDESRKMHEEKLFENVTFMYVKSIPEECNPNGSFFETKVISFPISLRISHSLIFQLPNAYFPDCISSAHPFLLLPVSSSFP